VEAGAERVVAIGGDGTALDVAAGLLAAPHPVPMAHVPQGTANVLALNLGIPASLDGAVAVAVGGVVTRIDVGTLRRDTPVAADREDEATPGGFLLSVGTGLHAEIVARTDRRAKRRWGAPAYLWAGYRSIGETPPARYRLMIDGDELEIDATMIQVMNCGAVLMRRGWMLGPGISPVDGLLDVVVYRARTRSEYLRVAARVVQGAPTATRLVLHRRAERVRIEAEGEVAVQCDGEASGSLPVELGVLRRTLPVVVPPESPWADAGSGDREPRAAGTTSVGR
jgi:diacylglycerol kinase family enzyme